MRILPIVSLLSLLGLSSLPAWWTTTDVLYNPQACLYYRDNSFSKKRTKSGRKVFWSRGNGWVAKSYHDDQGEGYDAYPSARARPCVSPAPTTPDPFSGSPDTAGRDRAKSPAPRSGRLTWKTSPPQSNRPILASCSRPVLASGATSAPGGYFGETRSGSQPVSSPVGQAHRGTAPAAAHRGTAPSGLAPLERRLAG